MNKIHLAGGASTQSRGRRPLPPGALAARTLDTYDVRELVDFEMSDGSHQIRELLSWVGGQAGLLFGAGPYQFEIARTLPRGEVSGSYGHRAEWELAAALGEIWGPIIQRPLAVRFFQNGGDACAAAAKLARFATGREDIASCGYHGAQAEFVHSPALGGVPHNYSILHDQFDFGDYATMRALALRAAAVVVEVPGWDDEGAIANFLADCRAACGKHGAIFIMDEVVTGFRLALGGACERYHVRPDIVCLGKAMSATGCVAAVIGDEKIVGALADRVFYSTTFGGSPGPCLVAAATVRFLSACAQDIYGPAGRLATIGSQLKQGLIDLGIKCEGQAERFATVFPTEAERQEWNSQMIARGVMVDRPFFTCLAHDMRDVEKTLEAARAVREGK